MRGTRSMIFLVVIVAGVTALLMGFASTLLPPAVSDDIISFRDNQIGLVEIEGGIFDADDVLEEIDHFRKKENIKGVVVRLDSPGGSVAASQEILEAVLKLRETKPVVASMGSVAASGAYYVACGAQKIVANPGTITGSIGVRMEHVEFSDLLQLIKVKHETLKSGEFKDIGAFDRPMTEDERRILQGVLTDLHDQFKTAVAHYRSIDRAEVDRLADGRIYSGKQALELKLVDMLGGVSEAVRVAGELAGIAGEPEVVRFRSYRRYVDNIFGVFQNTVRFRIPHFLYAIPDRF